MLAARMGRGSDFGRGMPGGVVEQVAQHPRQPDGVADHPCRRDIGADVQRRFTAKPLRLGCYQVVQVDIGVSHGQPAFVGARQQQ